VEIRAVIPFPNISLNFQEAYAIGDQLWALGKVLQDDPKYTKPPNWVLTYRYAVRAMLARIMTVDREYRGLNEVGRGTAPAEEMTTQKARNWWNVVWESYARVLFFAMDSSLECFAYALNALGCLLSPSEFLDITADERLRRITPANLFDPPSKGNAGHSAYTVCLNEDLWALVGKPAAPRPDHRVPRCDQAPPFGRYRPSLGQLRQRVGWAHPEAGPEAGDG
jgi:hypothetical protein